jgi:uncharacterized protein (TIGR02996 family)
MTDADALLAAAVAAPEDDLPRLVFADWLDEHGDPDRAEFIRLQIALARGQADEPAVAAARARELLAEHKPAWEIPGLQPAGQSFRRGFVEGLRMAAEPFVAHAERISRAAPVVELRLQTAAPFLVDLATVPWLDRVETLDLRANNHLAPRLGPFFAAARLPRLRALNLQNTGLAGDDYDTLAAAAGGLPRLERLVLSGNYVGDAGCERLAGARSLAGLRELVMRCDMIAFSDAIHAAGAAALAESPHLTDLRSLDLAGHHIGDAGLRALAHSPNAAALEVLDVSQNDVGEVGDSGVEALTESPHLGRLRRLDLTRNRLGRLGAAALARWPHLPRMEAVILTAGGLTPTAHDTLLNSPHADRFVINTAAMLDAVRGVES